jgi:hypothetical protein
MSRTRVGQVILEQFSSVTIASDYHMPRVLGVSALLDRSYHSTRIATLVHEPRKQHPTPQPRPQRPESPNVYQRGDNRPASSPPTLQSASKAPLPSPDPKTRKTPEKRISQYYLCTLNHGYPDGCKAYGAKSVKRWGRLLRLSLPDGAPGSLGTLDGCMSTVLRIVKWRKLLHPRG